MEIVGIDVRYDNGDLIFTIVPKDAMLRRLWNNRYISRGDE